LKGVSLNKAFNYEFKHVFKGFSECYFKFADTKFYYKLREDLVNLELSFEKLGVKMDRAVFELKYDGVKEFQVSHLIFFNSKIL